MLNVRQFGHPGGAVFSSELNGLRAAWASNRRAVLFGALIGTCALILLISSRVSPVILFGLLFVWTLLSWDRISSAVPPLDAVTGSVAAFLGYSAISGLWAANLVSGEGIVLMAVTMAAASMVLTRAAWLEDRASSLRLGEGLWIGFVLALIYLLIEIRTGQAIKIWVYNMLHFTPDMLQPKRYHKWVDGVLVKIYDTTLTRNAAPITPLLWPSLMAALGGIARPWNVPVAVAIFVLAFIVAFLSPHESSKVAIVAGSFAFAMAWFSREWARRIISAGWVAACLLVVPAALLAHKLDLHNASWIQPSAQHRIIIWNFTAEHVLEQPIFGTGVFTTYKRGPEITRTAVNEPGERYKRKMSRHSHNVYLQTWFEFGVIGAMLLAAFGVMLLARIRRLHEAVQPFGFAAFTSVAALMASSYGMWQAWFVALFALTPVLYAIGGRTLETADGSQNTGAPSPR